MAVTQTSQSPGHVGLTISAIDASAASSSSEVSVSAYTSGSFQFVWASHDDTSTVELQASNDGTNFDTITGSSTTTSGASGTATIYLTDLPGGQIRATITETDANIAATITTFAVLKRSK